MSSTQPPPWGVMGRAPHLSGVFPPKHKPVQSWESSRPLPQPSLGDSLQDTWPAPFKSGKVLQTKERLEEPYRFETKDTTNSKMGSQAWPWNRKWAPVWKLVI